MRVPTDRVIAHLRAQWAGLLALFLVLTGGVAYAANTVFSSDIVNDEVYSVDVRDDTLAGGGLGASDLRDGSVRTGEILNDVIRSADIRDDGLAGGGLGGVDLRPGSVRTSEVLDDSLTGADIDESSLAGVDADLLGGLDSTKFVQATQAGTSATTGHIYAEIDHVNAVCASCFALQIPDFGRVRYSCLNAGFAPPSGEMTFWFETTSAGTTAVYTDHGAPDPDFEFLGIGQESSPTPAKDLSASEVVPERVIFQIERANGAIATAIVSGVLRETINGEKCDLVGNAVVVG